MCLGVPQMDFYGTQFSGSSAKTSPPIGFHTLNPLIKVCLFTRKCSVFQIPFPQFWHPLPLGCLHCCYPHLFSTSDFIHFTRHPVTLKQRKKTFTSAAIRRKMSYRVLVPWTTFLGEICQRWLLIHSKVERFSYSEVNFGVLSQHRAWESVDNYVRPVFVLGGWFNPVASTLVQVKLDHQTGFKIQNKSLKFTNLQGGPQKPVISGVMGPLQMAVWIGNWGYNTVTLYL